MAEIEITSIWDDYQRGKDYLDSINLFSRTEQCHNFVNGDQWNGLKYGQERPPSLNILLPMMKSSTALVGHNSMVISHTSMNYGSERSRLLEVCRLLDLNARQNWERMKLDMIMWDILQDAYISGDSFLYFYDDETRPEGYVLCEQIDNTNIMLGDEQQPDIQKQPYILIIQRKNIDEIKDFARRNGVDEDTIEQILPDNDTRLQINGTNEVKNNKKLTVVAKLWKKDGKIHISRSTKSVVIQEDTEIPLTSYPIVKYTWKKKKGLARGDGDVWDKIPNQISINKALYRLEQSVKGTSYPIKVYRQGAISQGDVDKLNQPGRSIAVKGSPDQGIHNIVNYLQPRSIAPTAVTYWQTLMQETRNLSGTGDNLENVNPNEASGVAIQQIMAAKELNTNMQVAYYKQFVEDIARIWYDMLCAYNPNGVNVVDTNDQPQFISYNELLAADVSIKISVVSTETTYTALKDAALKELLGSGQISFEEYVEALDDTSIMPVTELHKIVEARKANAEMQPEIADMIMNTNNVELGANTYDLQDMR